MSGTEAQRQLVRQHLVKLRRALEQAIKDHTAKPYEMPLAATIAMENTLIAVYQEAALSGRREGYVLGLETGRNDRLGTVRPGPIEPTEARADDTPARPSIPWRGPRRKEP